MKHLLDRQTRLLLIKRIVFSKLYYCSTVWANTSKTNIHKLQLVQNFPRELFWDEYISEGLKSLRMLRAKDRLEINGAVMVFNALKQPCC